MSLRWKIFLSLILVALLPVAGSLLFSQYEAQRTLKGVIGRSHLEVTREKAATISIILAARIDEALLLARNPVIREAVREIGQGRSAPGQQAMTERMLRIDREWIARRGDLDAARAIRGNVLSRFLDDYLARDPGRYGELFVTDRFGANAGMTSILSDYYQADEYWWQEGVRLPPGGSFLDDRGYDDTAGAIVLGVVTPVYERDELIGMVKINFRVQGVLDVVAGQGHHTRGRVTLARVGGSVIVDSGGGRAELSAGERGRLTEGDTGQWRTRVEGVPLIGAHARVRPGLTRRLHPPGAIRGIHDERYGPTIWYVLSEVEEARAFALVTALEHAALLILAIALLLAGGLALVLSCTLAGPLQALERGVRRIGDGDLAYRIGSRANDELGRLARSFDAMATRMQTTLASRDQLDREVAERIRAERDLQRLNAELEQRVAQRTHDLENATRVAEEANRAKSLFLANMSHELRTPLNAILGFAQLMERDAGLSDEHRRDLGIVNRSGRYLLALINDVLEISKIEAGRVEMESQVFDLVYMLDELRETMQTRAQDKGLELEVSLSPDVPNPVRGDGHKLRHVLVNLLGNAVKFTDHGWVALAVTRAEEGAIPRVRFEVSDGGCGIELSGQTLIFDAFRQSGEGVRRGEGTGLGLTISRNYVRLLGGDIQLESEPGRGSCFRFDIPLETVDIGEPEHAGDGGRVVGLEPGQPQRRILVVEDLPDNRLLLRRLLEAVGFQVREGVNGEQAVELFRSWRPDLIWMDVRMPVMDGCAAIRRIRALPGGAELVIVVVSASVVEQEREAMLAAGCNAVVQKPFSEREIFAAMEEWLGVRLRREKPTGFPPRPSAGDEPLAAGLMRLSAELRQGLRQAALALDVEATAAAIERIRERDPAVADGLADLAADFRYERLVELCGEAGT